MAADLCFPVKRVDHFMIPDAMFRTRKRPTHGGIDLTPVVANQAEPIVAIEDGTIIIADKNTGKGDTSGMDIMLLGKRTGIRWWYGHLSKVAVDVRQTVKRGQVMGATGTTGSSASGKASSTGVHLHLEAHYPAINTEIDPWAWLHDAPDVDDSVMPLAPTREQARRDYVKASAPLTRKDFLMALTDDEQAEVLRLLRENADNVAKVDKWVEAVRGDQLYDSGTKSRAERIHTLLDGITVKVDALHDGILAVGARGYSWLDRIRSVMNTLEQRKQ